MAPFTPPDPTAIHHEYILFYTANERSQPVLCSALLCSALLCSALLVIVRTLFKLVKLEMYSIHRTPFLYFSLILLITFLLLPQNVTFDDIYYKLPE